MRARNIINCALAAAVAATLAVAQPGIAAAQDTLKLDTLKLAVGQRGLWDTSVAEIGHRGGIFKRHGLDLEILYTQGSGETQQAVISGSVEIGVAAGIMGALSAYAKGAPVRIIGAEITGAADLYWYVKSDSPIRRLEDIGDKTIAYSTNGSSTHGIVTAFLKQYDLKANPVATGNPASTLTQVMSDQVDVGWSAPPFGLDQLDAGQIRIIASGDDASVFKGQTVRLLITNAQTLQAHRRAIERFMQAYRETVDWMYADPAAVKVYADFLGITEAKALRTRDGFFPKEAISPDRIVGLDAIVNDAVSLKYTAAPLTREQLVELIQIPPR